MNVYSYSAHTSEGKDIEGRIRAVSERQALATLTAEGNADIRLHLIWELAETLPRRDKRLAWADLHLLADELTAVTEAGLPIGPALEALAADLRDGPFRDAIAQLRAALDAGKSLSEAFAGLGHRLPPQFAALASAGEASGNLPGILQIAAGYAARMTEFQHRWRLIMAYPMVLAAGSILLILFLLMVVTPEYIVAMDSLETYEQRVMPYLTLMLIHLSRFLNEHALALLGGIVLVASGGYLALAPLRRTERGRILNDRLLRLLPGVGRIRHLSAMVRFTRAWAVMLRAGVKVTDSLVLAGIASGSPELAKQTRDAANAVENGESLADAFAATRRFGHDFLWFLSTGEGRGCPEDALERVAEKYTLELDIRERALGAMVNPVVVVATGAVILAIMTALYWPLLNINQMLGNRMGGGM